MKWVCQGAEEKSILSVSAVIIFLAQYTIYWMRLNIYLLGTSMLSFRYVFTLRETEHVNNEMSFSDTFLLLNHIYFKKGYVMIVYIIQSHANHP